MAKYFPRAARRRSPASAGRMAMERAAGAAERRRSGGRRCAWRARCRTGRRAWGPRGGRKMMRAPCSPSQGAFPAPARGKAIRTDQTNKHTHTHTNKQTHTHTQTNKRAQTNQSARNTRTPKTNEKRPHTSSAAPTEPARAFLPPDRIVVDCAANRRGSTDARTR